MGYVKDIDMIAYLTQKGKEHFFSGKKLNIRITHFSIADPDTNYLVASKTIYNTLGEKNILQKNFVPNISGVYGSEDNCLKYVSDGIEQKYTLYGGCPDVGEHINSDLSVTCEKPIPSNLLLETKTFVNGQIKDNFAISYVTNDQDSSGLEQTDYVFTKVKRELNKNTTARFDLDFNYQLLDENGFRKTSPNGYEIFNIIFNSFDTNIFKIENTLYYENNNFISNPLNLQSTNKFMLLKTENIDETYGGNFFYVKDINVEDFLKLPQYGWNTVADMHVEIINGIDTIIVPKDPITKIQKNLNKKIRFYKPTSISLKQNSTLSTDGKTLDLGTKKSNINTITTFTFFINFDIFLNSNSPEGKEIAYLNIYGYNNLDLKFKNFDTKIVFNKGELVKTFNNVEVELTIDSTNLFDPIQGQFNLFISNVNDYVLVNSDQISYTFTYKSNKQYKVTTNSNPNNTYGTVTGAGTYNEGDTVTIIATPNTDYRFIKLEEKTNNQLTNTYTSPTRTFNIANDIDFTGYFGTKLYNFREAVFASSLPFNNNNIYTVEKDGYSYDYYFIDPNPLKLKTSRLVDQQLTIPKQTKNLAETDTTKFTIYTDMVISRAEYQLEEEELQYNINNSTTSNIYINLIINDKVFKSIKIDLDNIKEKIIKDERLPRISLDEFKDIVLRMNDTFYFTFSIDSGKVLYLFENKRIVNDSKSFGSNQVIIAVNPI